MNGSPNKSILPTYDTVMLEQKIKSNVVLWLMGQFYNNIIQYFGISLQFFLVQLLIAWFRPHPHMSSLHVLSLCILYYFLSETNKQISFTSSQYPYLHRHNHLPQLVSCPFKKKKKEKKKRNHQSKCNKLGLIIAFFFNFCRN